MFLQEIELYDEALLRKPAILCLNKIDSDEGRAKIPEILKQIENRSNLLDSVPEELRPTKLIEFYEVLPISAKMNTSVNELKERLRDVLDHFDDATKFQTTKQTTLTNSVEDSMQLDKPLI